MNIAEEHELKTIRLGSSYSDRRSRIDTSKESRKPMKTRDTHSSITADRRVGPMEPFECNYSDITAAYSLSHIEHHQTDRSSKIETQRENRRSSRSISRQGWIVIIGHSILMVFTIIFLILPLYRQCAIPNRSALLVKRSPRISILIVTGLATICSTSGSYLFSRAVVIMLQRRLKRPISLIQLVSIIELSRGSLSIKLSYLSYCLIPIVLVALLETLTASFATLLTPTRIEVMSTIRGSEIDFASAAFNEFFMTSPIYNQTVKSLQSNDPTALGPLLTSSGIASAYSELGSSSLLKFRGAFFNASTAGVLPILKKDVSGMEDESSTQKDVKGILSNEIPSRFSISGQTWKLGKQFSSNHTMFQQGFTAKVKCKVRNVSEPNRPSLLSSARRIEFPDANVSKSLNYTLFQLTFDAKCPDGQVLVVDSLVTAIGTRFLDGGIAQVTLCSDQDLSGSKTPGHHFTGSGGGYGFLDSTVCEIDTRITNVQVNYKGSINSGEVNNTQSITSENALISRAIVSLLSVMISKSQTIYTTGFGDVIKAIYNSQNPSSTLNTTYFISGGANTTFINQILELYFKGQVEFLASYFRAAISVGGVFPDDQLPQNMTKNVKGEWYTESIGWDQTKHKKTPYILGPLIPIFVIGSLSMILVLGPYMDYSEESGRNQNPKFQPDNLIEVLVASTYGELGIQLRRLKGQGLKKIGLQQVEVLEPLDDERWKIKLHRPNSLD
ncbi:uncharacterized protein MELLADRAFT_109107 [Melampsora larici-populina 98AG31]|uniref:Uncharacterized protein n=1 Tax=Melampsora larici-populina (strain 98AG31 / pathotype 3-4-7) TaxID=747676 RepID=F4RVC2_MELLP|nr:uncharacterized protein MELLADRAFT_109107 [Melampsora larici-populina 98AG31]EGG03695.1 hypothetical protein MELLADRAFT_109107 [Melampsora larici-populina 98AG31]